MDISKLAGIYRFSWEVNSLGCLLVNTFTTSAHYKLRSKFKNYLDADSTEFARVLAIILCQKDLDGSGKYTDDRISEEEASSLTEQELEEFSKLFIEKNVFLKRDHSNKNVIRKEDKGGKTITAIHYETRKDAEKAEGESYRDLLKRLMHAYRLDSEESTKKLLDSIKPKHLFSNSVRDLIKENQNLSHGLADSISRDYGFLSTKFEMLQPPDNPTHETNRQLSKLGQEFGETALLIKNMNDLGLKMALEAAVSSKRSALHNTIMIGIAVITLIVTAFISYLSYSSSNVSSHNIEQLLIKSNSSQNESLKHQKANGAAIIQQLQGQTESIERLDGSQLRQNEALRELHGSQQKVLERLKGVEAELETLQKRAAEESKTPTP